MLFNSFEYIFFFLPIVALIFFLIGGKGHHRIAIAWLVAASIFFYSWWNPAYTSLILVSMLFNYATGVYLSSEKLSRTLKNIVLLFGIGANLALLGYYKYSNFFVDNINQSFGTSYHLETIILPLAISFYTFQQVAYMVDAYKGAVREYDFLSYCLFVTFFPQLIAGPIVHHKEVLPQFASNKIYTPNKALIAAGIVLFFLGLFKKVILADNMAGYSTSVFGSALNGDTITFFEAWQGSLAYTFQLYFDFSGYADMAIGSALIFGIYLPSNFDSPYKSVNIVEFWRRWHITLGRFLRDYIYIPLGGSRCTPPRQAGNLMATMLLGGLWHGAGWTFVLWGGLHGVYLIINHTWTKLRLTWFGPQENKASRVGIIMSTALTFLAVVIGWVFFRAENIQSAIEIIKGMFGINGFELPAKIVNALPGLSGLVAQLGGTISQHNAEDFVVTWISVGVTSLFLFGPNTNEIVQHIKQRGYSQVFKGLVPITTAVIAVVSILSITKYSEFLYFQF